MPSTKRKLDFNSPSNTNSSKPIQKESPSDRDKKGKSLKKLVQKKKGYVYVIKQGKSPMKPDKRSLVKIGVTTTSPTKRKDALQTGNPNPLQVLLKFDSANCFRDEKSLHNIFKDHHVLGEWFELDESDIQTIIQAGTDKVHMYNLY